MKMIVDPLLYEYLYYHAINDCYSREFNIEIMFYSIFKNISQNMMRYLNL